MLSAYDNYNKTPTKLIYFEEVIGNVLYLLSDLN